MATRRTTQADVARLAGVSTTAVSLVLNGRTGTRLSPDAVERVRAAAATLGYRPNLTARALSMQSSQILGFISDGVTTGRFGNDLIRGALEEAGAQHHVLFIAETGGDPDTAAAAVEALIDRQADGIIFASTHPDGLPIPPHPEDTPIVMLNATSDSNVPVVLADEFDGAKRIVDLLLSSGNADRVAIVGLSRSQRFDEAVNPGVKRRLDGIWASLDEHHIAEPLEIPCDPWTLENGYAAVKNLLAMGQRPNGLICLNDRIAFGAYRALHEEGVAIPDQISVVSFDDDDIAVYLEPKLTTAGFPYREMGALAVRVLLSKVTPQQEYLVPMPLLVRQSVRS